MDERLRCALGSRIREVAAEHAMPLTNGPSMTAILASTLSCLRCYGRALADNQVTGDRFAEATRKAVLADPGLINGNANKK